MFKVLASTERTLDKSLFTRFKLKRPCLSGRNVVKRALLFRDKEDLESNLASNLKDQERTEQELKRTQEEIRGTKEELTRTREELKRTKEEMRTAEMEIEKSVEELAGKQKRIEELTNEKSEIGRTLTNLRAQVRIYQT